jgi:hypothetical protein
MSAPDSVTVDPFEERRFVKLSTEPLRCVTRNVAENRREGSGRVHARHLPGVGAALQKGITEIFW